VPGHPQTETLNPSLGIHRRPWLFFGIWILVCAVFYLKPLSTLFRFAISSDDASHILLVPFISAWLFYAERKKYSNPTPDLRTASPLAVLAVAITAVILFHPIGQRSALAGLIGCFLLLLASGFIAIFGFRSFRSDWFPLAFLAFLVPLPERLLGRFIYLLQAGSAKIAETIFDWTGVPALRDGFVFHLPRINIEVAKECSGIRSSLALLILALLVAHFSFSKFWKKLVFVAAGLVMMIVKNGVRISTLTILANNVNPEFLYGRLHREGGVVFFLLGLALLLPVYWVLRRGEGPFNLATPKTSASQS